MFKNFTKNIYSINLFQYILYSYILLLPVQIDIINFNHLRGIQFSEILFFVIFIISLKKILINGFYNIFSKIDFIVLLVFLSTMISIIFGTKYTYSINDFFASFYFLIVYYIYKINIDKINLDKIIFCIILSVIITCLSMSVGLPVFNFINYNLFKNNK